MKLDHFVDVPTCPQGDSQQEPVDSRPPLSGPRTQKIGPRRGPWLHQAWGQPKRLQGSANGTIGFEPMGHIFHWAEL